VGQGSVRRYNLEKKARLLFDQEIVGVHKSVRGSSPAGAFILDGRNCSTVVAKPCVSASLLGHCVRSIGKPNSRALQKLGLNGSRASI